MRSQSEQRGNPTQYTPQELLDLISGCASRIAGCNRLARKALESPDRCLDGHAVAHYNTAATEAYREMKTLTATALERNIPVRLVARAARMSIDHVRVTAERSRPPTPRNPRN